MAKMRVQSVTSDVQSERRHSTATNPYAPVGVPRSNDNTAFEFGFKRNSAVGPRHSTAGSSRSRRRSREFSIFKMLRYKMLPGPDKMPL